MKIYTRTGDQGTTALFGAGRVSKDHIRISAYGTVDETNAVLGVIRASIREDTRMGALDEVLARIQNELFVLGADLATPATSTYPIPRVEAVHIEALEQDIDTFEADLPVLKYFIIPGGTMPASHLHIARTVCRRAERLVVEASATEDINEEVVRYLNRLSDLLFVLARWTNLKAGFEEPQWIPVKRA